MNKGLVHIYTGNGKGKTTSAMGLAIRCAGCGKKVRIYQFLKASPSGELESIKKLGIELFRVNTCEKFYYHMNEDEKKLTDTQAKATLETVYKVPCDMLVLDEVLCLLANGIITQEDIISLINSKPSETELVLTGFGAPEEIFEYADYVSEINCIKHPYHNGTNARCGVDF